MSQIRPKKVNVVLVELHDHPLQLAEHAGRLGDESCGAVVWFSGQTRRVTDRNGLTSVTETLFYEAQRTMAVAEMRRICDEAAMRFGLSGVALLHSLGEVPVGEASVLAGCCSPHRRDAFEAAVWLMDALKCSVPIWKREQLVDGEQSWVHPYADDPSVD